MRKLHRLTFLLVQKTVKRNCTIMEPNGHVLFEVRNNCGLITINKPSVLNALNDRMATSIMKQLELWKDTMDLVIIKGNGRAFCAGGDVKQLVGGGPNNAGTSMDMVRTVYRLTHLIGTYRLPYVAVTDGITMGGGVGVSVHGRYRVVTERTNFAMPEVGIGFIPDVGTSHALTRLPGHLGMFLALTGHCLSGVDCKKVGIGTHYCRSEDVPRLIEALVGGEHDRTTIEKTLDRYSSDTEYETSYLDGKMELIDRIFGLPSVEDIMTALECEGPDWCRDIVATLQKKSPTSLKLAHRQFSLGKTLGLYECLKMDTRLATSIVTAKISKDLYEGVRAMLIEKDKKPKWSPERLENVSDTLVQSCFLPLPQDQEF